MAKGEWATTEEEDVAILALLARRPSVDRTDTVETFIAGHIRHQVDFAMSETVTSGQDTTVAYDAATPEVRREVDTLLAPFKIGEVKKT